MGLQENIRLMLAGQCVDPFAFLGMHPVKDKYGKKSPGEGLSAEAEAACIVDEETGMQYHHGKGPQAGLLSSESGEGRGLSILYKK